MPKEKKIHSNYLTYTLLDFACVFSCIFLVKARKTRKHVIYTRVYTNLENREKSGNFKGQGKTGKSQGIL
jgi:hypothetical protein